MKRGQSLLHNTRYSPSINTKTTKIDEAQLAIHCVLCAHESFAKTKNRWEHLFLCCWRGLRKKTRSQPKPLTRSYTTPVTSPLPWITSPTTKTGWLYNGDYWLIYHCMFIMAMLRRAAPLSLQDADDVTYHDCDYLKISFENREAVSSTGVGMRTIQPFCVYRMKRDIASWVVSGSGKPI